jgi:hypothetical protein
MYERDMLATCGHWTCDVLHTKAAEAPTRFTVCAATVVHQKWQSFSIGIRCKLLWKVLAIAGKSGAQAKVHAAMLHLLERASKHCTVMRKLFSQNKLPSAGGRSTVSSQRRCARSPRLHAKNTLQSGQAEVRQVGVPIFSKFQPSTL